MLILKSHAHSNMNLKASYLHMLGDTISSVGVILGGLLIKYYNIVWVDPLLTIFIAIFIMRETYKIIKRSVDILMQSSANIDLDSLKKDISKIEKVKNIHHIHTWLSNEKTIYLEAHVEVEDMKVSETSKIDKEILKIFKEKYNIYHSTLQYECSDLCRDKE
jgi:cobalt-zinc-cadmium efflux system protein